MKKSFLLFLGIMVSLSCLYSQEPSALPQSIYDISAKTIDGRVIPFSGLRGKVLFIINTASDDRNSNQLELLNELGEKVGGQGVYILVFPSADFTSTEPTDLQALKSIYYDKYHLSFPIFETTHVTGTFKHPLYLFLTNSKTNPLFGRDIVWNYEKFVIDKNGNVVGRFNTQTKPDDPQIISLIQKSLSE